MTPLETVLAFTEAWAANDMNTARGFLADDVRFEGPMTTTRGADAYVEALGSWAELVTAVDVTAALGDDRQAMLLYEMTTAPFGTLRTAEHFEVRNGRIVTDTLVWDTYGVRD
jgi:limonene-1,2-epoxide hydrolase